MRLKKVKNLINIKTVRRFADFLSGKLSNEYPNYRSKIMLSIDRDRGDSRSAMDF